MAKFDFISKFLSPQKSIVKNGFDPSHDRFYSLPFGIIVPFDMDFVVPGEHYRSKISSYVQTNPMREDNFQTIYNNLKAVFVPMSSLSRDYLSATQAARETKKDMLLPSKMFDISMSFSAFYINFCPPYYLYYLLSNAVSVTSELLTNSNITWKVEDGGESDNRIPFTNIAITIGTTSYTLFEIRDLNQYLYVLSVLLISSHYNDTGGRTGTYSVGQFVNQIVNYSNSHFISESGSFFVQDALRLVDNLRVNNFLPHFEDVCAKFTTYVLGSQSPANEILLPVDSPIYFRFDNTYSSLNLLELTFDISNISIFNTGNIYGSRSFSLIPFIAFKYYICCVERSNYRLPDVDLLTLDYLNAYMDNNVLISDNLSVSQYIDSLSNLLDSIHRDLDAGDPIADESAFLVYLFTLTSPLLPSDVFTSSQLTMVEGSMPTISGSFDLKNLNELSAVFELRQSLLRAGVSRKDQMKAIFGVEGNQHVFEPVQILDESRTPVTITGLLNQAESEFAPLGARASKGNGQNSLDFTFDSKDYGFIFYIQYFTIDVVYENFMTAKSYFMTPQDWWMPVYNNLGLTPILNEDVCHYNKNGENFFDSYATGVQGFTSNYWYLKTRVDTASGLFTNVPMPKGLDRGQYRFGNDPSLYRGNAINGAYISTILDNQFEKFGTERSLYFYPWQLNNIFENMVDSLVFSGCEFDNFKIATHVETHKVSPMPALGLLHEL